MCICDKVDALHFILSRKSRMHALGASHLAHTHEMCALGASHLAHIHEMRALGASH